MKKYEVKDIRNLAFISHGGTGKTTLAEAVLFNAGASTRLGKVDQGTTVCDFDDDEKKRKISISSKLINYEWKGKGVFAVVTPGYADFFGDVTSSLHVVDGAVVLVCGCSGIEVGTQKAWKEADKNNLPRMIFINKLDKENSNYFKTVDSIRNVFGNRCVPLTLPIGQEKTFSGAANILTGKGVEVLTGEAKDRAAECKLMLEEIAAEADDALTEKYLNEGALTQDELVSGLRKGISNRTVIPILCGSADKNIGTTELMDAISEFMPSPADIGAVSGIEEGKSRLPEKNAPFSAFVFKNVLDPYTGNLSYFRIYSGTLRPNAEVLNSTTGSKEKIGNISIMNGKDQKQVDEASAGDIVVVAKLKSTTYNQTLCDLANPIEFKKIVFPRPSTSFAVRPKSKNDEEKLSTGLHRVTEEDPTLVLHRNVETHEQVISGMGDLHVEIVLDRLKKKFGAEIETSIPKVAYKETIKIKAEGHEKYKKQSGGRGQYGEVFLKIEPLERGKGFEFVDEIVGGAIPKNYIPAVEKGIVGAMEEGILAGYRVVDVRAILYDGSYHDVDSSEMSFKIAGSKGFKDACGKAKMVLLEPIMNVDIYIPSQYMGDITGILNSKRGRIMGMEETGDLKKISATVPIAEMFKFSNELRSVTGGRGSFEMEFSHYEEVPSAIAQKVIEAAKKEHEMAAKE